MDKDFRIKKHCFSNTETTKTKENKNKHYPIKTTIKKTLVRNTEKQLPEVKIIKDDIKKCSERSVQTDTIRKQTCTCKNLPSSFDVPKPYTLVKLCKQINCLDAEEKTKKDKKLASDEKVLKNLNFPYDKPIYKDLIPLMCEKNQSPPTSVRSPLPQKDKEPVLSDFLELKKFPDYFVLHSTEIEDKMSQTKNNNLRLYKILDINS